MSMEISVLFIRKPELPDVQAELANLFSSVQQFDGCDWLACDHTDATPVGPYDAYDHRVNFCEAASEKFDEAIYIFIDGMAGQFGYEHGQQGRMLRKLLLLGDPLTWVCAEGEPEPWERPVMFDERRMRTSLATLRDAIDDPQSYAARAAELERIYKDGILAVGATEPTVNAEWVVNAIFSHFGLRPGRRDKGGNGFRRFGRRRPSP